MKKIITLVIALFMVFSISNKASAQNGVNLQDSIVEIILNRDTTVDKYIVDSNLTDNDGRKYYTFTAIKTNKSVVLYKFIEFSNGWYCVRQVYTVHNDETFTMAWEYIKTITVFDKKALRHYYDRGEKVTVYWIYNNEYGIYYITYEISY